MNEYLVWKSIRERQLKARTLAEPRSVHSPKKLMSSMRNSLYR